MFEFFVHLPAIFAVSYKAEYLCTDFSSCYAIKLPYISSFYSKFRLEVGSPKYLNSF